MSTLSIEVQRPEYETPPAHHDVAAEPGQGWAPYLPSWGSTSSDAQARDGANRPASRSSSSLSRRSSRKRTNDHKTITGFRNPWPSWHKPTRTELWRALEWGEDTDPCIKLAAAHIKESPTSGKSSSAGTSNVPDRTKSAKKQAARLLRIIPPDFAFDPQQARAKTTWLGHAGVLLQLPPLTQGGRPVRCLFDPIFSMRCSPTQAVGPIRSYAPPCRVEDLPLVDIVMISHNHYDHLDYDTIMTLWKVNRQCIRFLVPLGNRQWFIDCGIEQDRVTELDWWEVACIAPLAVETGPQILKITCTPSQHNSGRSGADADVTLWSSWYLEHSQASGKPYRIYFAGDSGYQFHESPGWPPPPSTGAQRDRIASQVDDDSPKAKNPVCPAFKQIATRLGSPHLLLLPVAVGATYDYFRSFVPVPDSISPIPRHSAGVTAHNHMPPWDAVRILRVMTENAAPDETPAVAIAIHWGTFVIESVEVLKTLGQLEWACDAHGVRFARSLEGNDRETTPRFLALDHGQSVTT